jgi:hypothetical protein
VGTQNVNPLLGAPHKFTYKRFTVAEMHKAFAKLYAEQPKLDPFRFCLNEQAHKAVQTAMMEHWEVIQCVTAPCPNCNDITLDGHCRHCDYPYNEK